MPIKYLPESDNYLVTCTVRLCYVHVCKATLELATEHEQNHKCPQSNGQTHYSWEITMTLVETMWAILDNEFDKLIALNSERDGKNDDLRAFAQHRLRGMAEMTALYMSPHFRDADEIAREVVHRKQMRDAGQPYETPGIGSRRYEMPRYEPSAAHKETQTKRESIQELNARSVSRTHQQPKAKPTVKIVGIDAETRSAIAGLKGFAEANEVATIYGVAVEDVETIWQN